MSITDAIPTPAERKIIYRALRVVSKFFERHWFALALLAYILGGFTMPIQRNEIVVWMRSALVEKQPRHIADSQKQRLVDELSKLSSNIDVLNINAALPPESQQYLKSFKEVFELSGIDYKEDDAVLTFDDTRPEEKDGILIGVYNKDSPPAQAMLFGNALKRAGFDFNYITSDGLKKGEFEFLIGYNE